jgi:hypothetical protein
LVVTATELCRQHPQGPAINVSNFQTSSSGTSRGPLSTYFLSVDGGRYQTSSSSTSRGPTVDDREKSSRQSSGAPKNWPHLRVRSLSRGGLGGLYRHPEDRVPPHTSSKSRQGACHASTRCHVSRSFRPHLLPEVGFGAVTCPVTPGLASLLR